MPSHGIGRTSGCRAAVYAAAFAAAVAATLAAVMRIAVPLACTRLAAVARAARARRLHTCRPSPSSGPHATVGHARVQPAPSFPSCRRLLRVHAHPVITKVRSPATAPPVARKRRPAHTVTTRTPQASPARMRPSRASACRTPATHPHGRWFPSARTRWRPRSAVRRVRGGVGQFGT